MDFPPARPDAVRAINQRWLLQFWNKHLTGHRVPPWQKVEAQGLNALSTNLSLLDVAAGDGQTRYLIRFHGSVVGQVYGSSDCRGKFLDEVLPSAAGAHALAPYHQAVASGCPVYVIQDVTDRQDRVVHYERLLLPFGRDGQSVDRILASFEFICDDGGFDPGALLASQKAAPVVKLAATIAAA
jgi:hypothetical protein